MLAKVRLLGHILADGFRGRRAYLSGRDAWTALQMRVAATGIGRRLIGDEPRRVATRVLPRPVTLRPGTHDIFGLKEIAEWGEYAEVASWGLPEDAGIVDLGGNIGLASLFFSTICPRSRIVTVEPDPDNLRILRENCRELIESGRMTAVAAFVAAEDGSAAMDRSNGTLGGRMAAPAEGDGQGETIPCISMHRLLAENGVDRIDLLKCDVEGAEAQLLRDCRDWIGRVENILIETHEPDCDPTRLYAMLEQNGWDFRVVSEHRKGRNSTCTLRRAGAGGHRVGEAAGRATAG